MPGIEVRGVSEREPPVKLANNSGTDSGVLVVVVGPVGKRGLAAPDMKVGAAPAATAGDTGMTTESGLLLLSGEIVVHLGDRTDMLGLPGLAAPDMKAGAGPSWRPGKFLAGMWANLAA